MIVDRADRESRSLRTYAELNFIDLDKADAFVKRTVSGMKKSADDRIRVLEIGSGIGIVTVPLLWSFARYSSTIWQGIEKDSTRAEITRRLLEFITSRAHQHNDAWKIATVGKLIDTYGEATTRTLGQDGNRIKSSFHRVRSFDLTIEIRDVEDLVLRDGESLKSYLGRAKYDVLFVPYILYHLAFWPKVLNSLIHFMNNPFILVLGGAGGDWLLHDNLLSFYLIEEINVKALHKLNFWRHFWSELSSSFQAQRRETMATSFRPVTDFICTLGYEIEQLETVEYYNDVRFDSAKLINWITRGPASIWKEVRKVFESQQQFEQTIQAIVQEQLLPSHFIHMHFENCLTAFKLNLRPAMLH